MSTSAKYPNRIYAPFTPEQVSALDAWQKCDWVHPFTCCDHIPMTVETKGFICPKCNRVQEWALAFMAEGAPPKPTFNL